MPATLLGQLAVDRDYQGQGHAVSLLLFALRTALRAADTIASAGVLTHPLVDGVRRFYARWGFQIFPSILAGRCSCAWRICTNV